MSHLSIHLSFLQTNEQKIRSIIFNSNDVHQWLSLRTVVMETQVMGISLHITLIYLAFILGIHCHSYESIIRTQLIHN